MICSNCNKELPVGSNKCPHCAEVVSEVSRCPNCWARITKNDENCPKCGCDIKERIKELEEEKNAVVPSIADKIKLLPKWIKITVPSVLLALIIILSSVGIYINISRKVEAVRLAEDYVISMDIAFKSITKLAQAYEDMVYKKSWLDRTTNAAAIREVYAKDISLIKRTREPIFYSKTQIEDLGNKEINAAVNDMYESYCKCYNYVIGENGKYPGYMEEYKKLYKGYSKATQKIKKIAEKYK